MSTKVLYFTSATYHFNNNNNNNIMFQLLQSNDATKYFETVKKKQLVFLIPYLVNFMEMFYQKCLFMYWVKLVFKYFQCFSKNTKIKLIIIFNYLKVFSAL